MTNQNLNSPYDKRVDDKERLRRKMQSKPRLVPLHRDLGLLLWSEGNLLDALIEFRKVHQIEPDGIEALYAMAAISLERGMPGKTYEYLCKAGHGFGESPLSLSPPVGPDFPAPYNAVDWNELFGEIVESIEEDAEYLENAVRQGTLCLEHRQYAKALDIFTRLVALRPRHASLRIYRAIVFAAQQKDDEAEKELAEVLNFEPKNPAAWKGMATLYERRGDKVRAMKFYSKVLEYDPTDMDARSRLELKEAV